MEKVGFFLCGGCGISEALDTEKLMAAAKEAGAVHCALHPCLCDEQGAASLRQALAGGQIDSLVIAACSARHKNDVFNFDRTRAALERLPLREQAVWSQPAKEENTQMLAEDLTRMWVARVAKENLAKPMQEKIEQTVLVVGGGLAGLVAARAASQLGHPVVLVERQDRLGGHLAGLREVAPHSPPYDQLHPNPLPELRAEVEKDANIKVLLGCTVGRITGQPGQFEVTVRGSAGEQALRAGAIVQATGARPYDAGRLQKLGYGLSPDVITTEQLDRMLAEGALFRPSDHRPPESVLFVQCAGSRDAEHLPYCSGECCLGTLRQVAAVHRDFPGTRSLVVYRDMRTPGQYEHFYRAVQENCRALFVRGEVEKVEAGGGKLRVSLGESLLGPQTVLEADLVVLATGMVPNSADGESIRAVMDAKTRIAKHESDKQVEDAQKIVDQLGHHQGTEILRLEYRQGPDLPVLRYGFPDSHYICFPYETRRTGIYTAGALHAPMDPAQAEEYGWGAATKAAQCIRMAARGEAVHPRAGDVSIADFFLQRCTQCKRCTEECPFGTINEDEKGTPQYNPLRCRRCGICLGSCPERIISFPEYSVDAVAAMIKNIQVPDETEEKPRIVALLCENDALPALEEAAARGRRWSPWVRIIPVRCLGAVNTVWIADSLSRGIDGVILIGCRRGDDYQCHYIRGSELANTRMTNVQETLSRLTLESERVQVFECARHEYERAAQLIEEFAEKVEQLGPNPYKGF